MRYFTIAALFLCFFGCSEEYLNRYPLDEISSIDFFKTSNDLELFVNQYYPMAFQVNGAARHETIFTEDLSTDDFVAVQIDGRLRGSRVVPATGGWNYSTIRSVNYFLANYHTVEEAFDNYRQFVGEAY